MSRGPSILHTRLGRLGAYAAQLEPIALETLAGAAVRAGLGPQHELSLVLCDNPTIQRINRRWRGKDKPTDVLSFPLHELKPGGLPPAGAVGDIILSLPTLREAARAEGAETEAHLRLLLVHGLLHLLGYDHATDAQERQMNRTTKKLLAGETIAR